jgi:hypothetical protein
MTEKCLFRVGPSGAAIATWRGPAGVGLVLYVNLLFLEARLKSDESTACIVNLKQLYDKQWLWLGILVNLISLKINKMLKFIKLENPNIWKNFIGQNVMPCIFLYIAFFAPCSISFS